MTRASLDVGITGRPVNPDAERRPRHADHDCQGARGVTRSCVAVGATVQIWGRTPARARAAAIRSRTRGTSSMSRPSTVKHSRPTLAELVFATDVASTTLDAPMVGAVVLAQDASPRVHQVGVPDQPAAAVEHGAIAERPIPPCLDHPDQPEPGLHRRPRVVHRVGECIERRAAGHAPRGAFVRTRACRRSSPAWPRRPCRRRRRPRAPHRSATSRRTARLPGADNGRRTARRRARWSTCARETRDTFAGGQPVVTSGELDRERRTPVAVEAVEVAATPQPQGRPSGHGTAAQAHTLLDDALLDRRAHGRRHVHPCRGPAPLRALGLTASRTGRAPGVDAHGVHQYPPVAAPSRPTCSRSRRDAARTGSVSNHATWWAVDNLE